MSNTTNNQELTKVINKVETLSKTVDQLQKEIDALKTKKQKDKTPNETDNGTKLASLKKLNFFRKDDKINGENNDKAKRTDNLQPETSPKSSRTKQDLQPLPDIKIERRKHRESNRSHVKTDTDNMHIDDKQLKTYEQSLPKSKIHGEEIIDSLELICCVKTRVTQTDDNKMRNQHVRLKDNECDNDKYKMIETKPIVRQNGKPVTNDCPYLTNNKEKKSLPKSKCHENCPYIHKEKCNDLYVAECSNSTLKTLDNKNRKTDKIYKNKKVMVDLTEKNNDKGMSFKCDKDKSSIQSCSFKDIDYEPVKSLKCDKIKNQKKKCKYCCKKIGSKNVLKIKKVIVTKDPPIIFVAPKMKNC